MKLPEDLDAICLAATSTWGQESQEAVFVGEIGEMLTMFGRRAQKRDSEDQWVDEIADGIIMYWQLAHLRNAAAVEKRIAEKLEKIKARLAKHPCKVCNGHMDTKTCPNCLGTGCEPLLLNFKRTP